MDDAEPRPQDQTTGVWGEVATLRFEVIADQVYQDRLWIRFVEEAHKLGSELDQSIRSQVSQRLGPPFDVRINVRPGSINIYIIISTTFAFIAGYKPLRTSFLQLLSDIRNIVSRIAKDELESDQFAVNSALIPGSAILFAEGMAMFNRTVNNAVSRIRKPLITLVISNVLLLIIATTAGLIWLL
jgi:hypothetical protein